MPEKETKTENTTTPNWWKDVVQKIDHILDEQGEAIIQESPGHGGQTLYGYVPQSIIDAANMVLGTCWNIHANHFDLKTIQRDGKERYVAVVKVEICIKNPDGTLTIREAYGGSENYTPGDALKGAETDAIGKALSLFSIGHLAYRGELRPEERNREPQEPEPGIKIKDPDAPATEKQKALFKARLDEALGLGIITQAKYDSTITAIEKGVYKKGLISQKIDELKAKIEAARAEKEKEIAEYEEENP